MYGKISCLKSCIISNHTSPQCYDKAKEILKVLITVHQLIKSWTVGVIASSIQHLTRNTNELQVLGVIQWSENLLKGTGHTTLWGSWSSQSAALCLPHRCRSASPWTVPHSSWTRGTAPALCRPEGRSVRIIYLHFWDFWTAVPASLKKLTLWVFEFSE